MPDDFTDLLPEGTLERANAAVQAGKSLVESNFSGDHSGDPRVVLQAAELVLRCAFDLGEEEINAALDDAFMQLGDD